MYPGNSYLPKVIEKTLCLLVTIAILKKARLKANPLVAHPLGQTFIATSPISFRIDRWSIP